MARFVRGDEVFDVWLEPGKGVTTREDFGPIQHETVELAVGMGPIQPETLVALEPGNQYRSHLIDRFESGWTRVLDPDRELHVEEPRHPALDAALVARPGDVHSYLVYADWLQQRGHPRGALITTQHARSIHDTRELATAEMKHLRDHAVPLLGTFTRRAQAADAAFDVVWERGFLKRARFAGHHRGTAEDRLWDLLRHPSARVLRELEIGSHGYNDNRGICAFLMHSGFTPPLRRIVIGDYDQENEDRTSMERAPIGNLARLSELYPQLEEVVLKGAGDVELGALDLTRARVFALRTSDLRAATLESITAARWPALEELELWIGDDRNGGDCTVEDLAPLFATAKFPALRRLRIMNTELSDEICPLIASAQKLASRLEELDFSLGTLTDAGAEILCVSRARFHRLRSLNVFHCSLSAEGLQRLDAADFPVEERPPAPRWTLRRWKQKSDRSISKR